MMISLFYTSSLMLSIYIVFNLNKWIFIWGSIELVTVMLVVLMSRKLVPRSVESLTKYFMAQAMASAFVLLGMVYRIFALGEVDLFSKYNTLSYGFMMLGLLVKIAAMPNPFWFIDVVSGLKLVEGFYVVVASKMVPMYLYILLSKDLFSSFLVLVGAGSVLVGSLMIMKQTNIRKIVALSSMSHLGWLILGLPNLSFQLSLLIFVAYLMMVLPLLWVGGYYNMSNLVNLKRSFTSPMVMFMLMVSLLSLGGFPPLVGFFYKWSIFLGFLSKSSYLICLFLIMMSLVSLFAYLRLCYLLYSLYNKEMKFSVDSNLIVVNSLDKWSPILLASVLIVVGGSFSLFNPIF